MKLQKNVIAEYIDKWILREEKLKLQKMNEDHPTESIAKIERQHMTSIVYEMKTKFDKKVMKVQ